MSFVFLLVMLVVRLVGWWVGWLGWLVFVACLVDLLRINLRDVVVFLFGCLVVC